MKSQGDASKLPVWARRRIESLESTIASQGALLEEFAGVATEEPGTVSFGNYVNGARPIPHGHHVTYHFERWFKTPMYIDVHQGVEPDSIWIGGAEQLLVVPHATNRIAVRLDRRIVS